MLLVVLLLVLLLLVLVLLLLLLLGRRRVPERVLLRLRRRPERVLAGRLLLLLLLHPSPPSERILSRRLHQGGLPLPLLPLLRGRRRRTPEGICGCGGWLHPRHLRSDVDLLRRGRAEGIGGGRLLGDRRGNGTEGVGGCGEGRGRGRGRGEGIEKASAGSSSPLIHPWPSRRSHKVPLPLNRRRGHCRPRLLPPRPGRDS